MRILFFSNLYPDAAEPGRGLPNARLVRRLATVAEVRVVSPRPVWPGFPLRRRQALSEDEPASPLYPPAWYLPRVGSRVNPWLMARCVRPALEELRRCWPFDVALAAWLYPDACALARWARGARVPLVAIAQGSDAHQYLRHPVRRRLMLQDLGGARRLIARSRGLADLLRQAGFAAEQVRVIYNGVDTARFSPGERRAARRRLDLPLEARLILWVGNLVPVKNPVLAVDALRRLPSRAGGELHLVMVGEGPLRPAVAEAARRARVSLLLAGRRSEADTAEFMRAADALCLTSDAEGTPNVVLEALASGLPVAATAVGGVPEVLRVPQAGRLVPANDAEALAAALGEILSAPPGAAEVRETIKEFAWEKTVANYLAALKEAVGGKRP